MSRSQPRATTEAGVYEGLWIEAQREIAAFKGLRYAASPTGSRRWAPPAPPPVFDGTRSAVDYGPAAPQPPGWDAPYRAAARFAGVDPRFVSMDSGPTDEDCLCLNIWTPALELDASPSSDSMPVMVWIHGGASVYGSGSATMFDGSRLAAEHGIVIVTLNYRLGVFGFFAHSALVEESPLSTAGNYGFLDQVAALEWVQRNITVFGGDPRRVTVFGESAGGRAVFELMAYPRASGLYQRAIAQSGWDETYHHRRLHESRGELVSAVELGRRVASELGLGEDAESVSHLRQVSPEELLAAAAEADPTGLTFAPIIDGVIFTDHPLALLAEGKACPVPLLLGFNSNEGSIFFLGNMPLLEPDAYRRYVASSYPEKTESILELYPPSTDPRKAHRSFSRLYGDRTFVLPSIVAARATSRTQPVFLYEFTHVHPPFTDEALGDRNRIIGAFHGSEQPLVFGTAPEPLDATDEALGSAMRAYWARFAATGCPNDPDLPQWPPFTFPEESYLELGDEIRPRKRPYADRYPPLAIELARKLSLEPTALTGP